MPCIFCDIVKKDLSAATWYEDENVLAFLDHKPLFEGHTLLIPKVHYETYHDLPAKLIPSFFQTGQVLANRIRETLGAQGTFVAMNNTVSQSVPHLHMHIVPRTKGDGLKGFFWPRQKYKSKESMFAIAESLKF
jgi:histidine triad (HIT) family protein